MVVVAAFRGQEVDDEVEVVRDDPAAVRRSGVAVAGDAVFLHDLRHFARQRLEVRRAVARGDEIEVGDRGEPRDVEQRDLLAFFLQQRFARLLCLR